MPAQEAGFPPKFKDSEAGILLLWTLLLPFVKVYYVSVIFTPTSTGNAML